VFNEYFQPRPTPTPTHNPQHQLSSNGLPAGAEAPASDISAEDRQLQTGIWGGLITPGSFFAAPLGSTSRNSQAGPSRPRLVPRATSSDIVTSPSWTQPQQAANSSSRVRPPNGIRIPSLVSGSTTPHSSNPPVVFTSTGANKEEAEENEEVSVRGTEEDARRQAGEAAMRRLGLSVTSVHSDVQNNSSIPLDPSLNSDGRDKGKQRAIPIETISDPPKVIPYLTSGLQPSRSWAVTGEEGIRMGLEERVRVLREVDEVIWGVVGELTRLGSLWDHQGTGEDEAES
jgi:E3 ubiquitin-protein ligase synoviolin